MSKFLINLIKVLSSLSINLLYNWLLISLNPLYLNLNSDKYFSISFNANSSLYSFKFENNLSFCSDNNPYYLNILIKDKFTYFFIYCNIS